MKIKIVSPVHHDGKTLEVGETVNIPDRAARDLVCAGAAEVEGKQKAASSEISESPNGGTDAPDGVNGAGQAGDQGGQK